MIKHNRKQVAKNNWGKEEKVLKKMKLADVFPENYTNT